MPSRLSQPDFPTPTRTQPGLGQVMFWASMCVHNQCIDRMFEMMSDAPTNAEKLHVRKASNTQKIPFPDWHK